ncbi:diacylglycerol/lipid kinase family protein [Halogeometricum limi]|uniref:Lipid kinase, YegS/Rv2252/BmrU family n=1 Tax=Halogeometricum limi TaxID=555875 RepID=A0A1I6HM21_9EURY|nr:diacylglycerol kinase family protein [Halogeometricum limi]SFR55511.1 lipid kinase, YegS/Rv2252/BmrU family [Halogeometricum limi]
MTDRILVLNPRSGDGKRSVRARTIAENRGYDVRESQTKGDTIDIARQAATERPDTIAACGGDGTLNEVIRGVDDAGRLDDVTLGVVPGGTGNDFADNVGIRGVEHAFDVLDEGRERRLDLGSAQWTAEASAAAVERVAPRPFLNSCVCGLTAEASARTSREAKRRLGVVAYVLSTLQRTRTFEGLQLDVRVGPAGEREPAWSGEALMLLVGNGRRFPGEQMRQANMEDGLLNVVVVENRPALDYLRQGAADRLLRRGASHLTRLTAKHLEVDAGTSRQFSLDGELVEGRHLRADARAGAMRFTVGASYEPSPSDPNGAT